MYLKMSDDLEVEMNIIINKTIDDLRARLLKCAKRYQVRAYKDGVSSMKVKKEETLRSTKALVVSPKRHHRSKHDSDSDSDN